MKDRKTKVIFEQGDWSVLIDGTVENVIYSYDVAVDQLTDKHEGVTTIPTWPLHMSHKSFVKLDDFIACYDFAVKMFRRNAYTDEQLSDGYRIARMIALRILLEESHKDYREVI